jgi:hypothetical protein
MRPEQSTYRGCKKYGQLPPCILVMLSGAQHLDFLRFCGRFTQNDQREQIKGGAEKKTF